MVWFYLIGAVVVVLAVAWWLRRPHHRRAGGPRAEDVLDRQHDRGGFGLNYDGSSEPRHDADPEGYRGD